MVSPKSLGFLVNLDKMTPQTKHFFLKNTGTLPVTAIVDRASASKLQRARAQRRPVPLAPALGEASP